MMAEKTRDMMGYEYSITLGEPRVSLGFLYHSRNFMPQDFSSRAFFEFEKVSST